jgi:hypothetical protein
MNRLSVATSNIQTMRLNLGCELAHPRRRRGLGDPSMTRNQVLTQAGNPRPRSGQPAPAPASASSADKRGVDRRRSDPPPAASPVPGRLPGRRLATKELSEAGTVTFAGIGSGMHVEGSSRVSPRSSTADQRRQEPRRVPAAAEQSFRTRPLAGLKLATTRSRRLSKWAATGD